jgi:hypothetical protein
VPYNSKHATETLNNSAKQVFVQQVYVQRRVACSKLLPCELLLALL